MPGSPQGNKEQLSLLMIDQVTSVDPVTGQAIIEVDNYVWDPIGLAWIKQTQAAGGGGGGPATIADGADVTQGAIADAAVAADTAGTVNAHLRTLTKQLPLPTGAATDAILIGGTQKAIARGGAKGITTAADVTGTAEGADHQALDVQIYSGGIVKDPTAIRALTSADVVTTAPPANASQNLTQVGGTAVTLGQKAAASSVPVVLDSDTDRGQKTMAASLPAALASDQSDINPNRTQANAAFVQPRQLASFTAVYRLAARPYALSNAFGAAGRKQFATIHHLATAVKTVKIQRVSVALESDSAASIVVADLVRITTAPATGNPAITQVANNPADAVSVETICLALPTTASTEAGVSAMQEWNLGITGTGSVLSPPPALSWYTLWPQAQPGSPENKFPTMRAGVLEGYAVTLDNNALSTVKGYVVIEFTEE